MAELKKCPFCGGEARLKHGKPWQQKKGVRIAFVQCRQCEAKSITRFQYAFEAWQDVDHDVINRWNNRPTEAEIRAKVIDEFAHELKEKCNAVFPLSFHCSTQYFTLEGVRKLVDDVAEQLKGE